jgi:hypothetical protein
MRTSPPTARSLAIRLTLGALALAAVALPATAEAAGRARIDVGGPGTFVIEADGSATVSADVTGRPFGGSSVTVLAADDGSLPEPGSCEPATATFHLAGAGREYLDVTATGDVCGEFVQLPYIVTHVFTGRYTVTDASKRNLVGTDGFFEVRLAASTAQAYVFGIDT